MRAAHNRVFSSSACCGTVDAGLGMPLSACGRGTRVRAAHSAQAWVRGPSAVVGRIASCFSRRVPPHPGLVCSGARTRVPLPQEEREIRSLASVVVVALAFVFAPARAAEPPARPYMVAAANPYAVDAGLQMLRAGGSAVDAAIAIQSVLTL